MGASDPPLSRIASHGWRPYLWLLLWPFFILWPVVLHSDEVLMQPKAPASDLLITHWPNAEVLRQSLFEFHQLPLWNPSILNGAPFAADPLAGLWYPPNWLTAVVPLPLAFNLLFILHLAWAGWGMYRWARFDGFNQLPALIGALAFAAMPKIVAHIAAGHLSLVYAVCWTPWTLMLVDKALTRPANSRALVRSAALAGLAWAAMFLADVRWGVMAGGVLAVWWLAGHGGLRRRVGGFGFCLLICLLVTAVLGLPMLQFVQLSSRAGLTAEEAAVDYLPPNYLIGLLIPNLGGFQEYMTYTGLVPLALALAGVRPGLRQIRRRTLTMIGLALAALWWALGPDAGLFWVASRLPGIALLRVPSRAWFIFGLAVCWLAVRGAAEVERGWRMAGRGWNLASTGVLASAWLLAAGGSLATQKPLVNLFVTALALTGLVAGLRYRQALPVLLVVAAAELFFVDATLIEPRPVTPGPVAEWLGRQPGLWRVYSPSYSLPQLDAAWQQLQQADGINPLQLASTVAYMDAATGVQRAGYSVTTPPFAGEVATANREALPDARLLGALNVRYVVSQFDLRAPGLELRTAIGGTRIYENSFDAGRVQGGALTSWTPGRIVVSASGPGRVTLAEVWYPGWTATVDGAPAEVEPAGLFRAVSISAGPHEVIFEFRPLVVYAGLGLTSIGLGLALYALRTRQ